MQVKLLPEDEETYVYVRSQARSLKEQSMRDRRLKRLLKTLRAIRLDRKRPLTRDELLKAVGAAQSKAGRDAKLVDICLPQEGQEVTPESFTYRINRTRLRHMRKREGCYLLRTNLKGADPAVLWKRYMQLVQVEEAFRNLKGDLGIRPFYHQLENHIEAHVFISFLAYCLHVTLRARLQSLAPGITPRSVFEKMATVQMIDVILPTSDGRTLILPRYTQPSMDVTLLLERLKLSLPYQPKPKITATQKIEM